MFAFAHIPAMKMRSLLWLSGLACLLAACSRDPQAQPDNDSGNGVSNAVVDAIDDAQNAVEDVVNVADPPPVNLMSASLPSGWGRDADAFTGQDIALEPIADAAALRGKGEMGCAFQPDGGDQPILAAKAALRADAKAVAVVGNAGVRQRLVSLDAGGFAALASGMRFGGSGVSAAVKLKSRESLTPVGKDSSYPANLEVAAGQARRIYSGRWICGL